VKRKRAIAIVLLVALLTVASAGFCVRSVHLRDAGNAAVWGFQFGVYLAVLVHRTGRLVVDVIEGAGVKP
jgi:hypothetical protein